jgi:hypothetical protein
MAALRFPAMVLAIVSTPRLQHLGAMPEVDMRARWGHPPPVGRARSRRSGGIVGHRASAFGASSARLLERHFGDTTRLAIRRETRSESADVAAVERGADPFGVVYLDPLVRHAVALRKSRGW